MFRLSRILGRPAIQRVIVVVLVGAVIAGGADVVVWLTRASLAIGKLRRGVGDTVFYTADGRPWFRMDEQRADVPLSAIAPELQAAVLAVEDHRFYHHFGIDPAGLLRAIVRNMREGEVTEGGSTLTQQLARTLFLSNARTYGRKVKEAAFALLLEQQLTKAQILELYLNRVYLSAGMYGVEPMSRALFGKHAADVTLAEAALIAGLIRAPSALSPWSNLDGALARRRVVLERMASVGVITRAEQQVALAERIRIQPYPREQQSRAGYAKAWLRQQFRDRFGGDHPPDWRVDTTFLPGLEDAAEQAVEKGLRQLNVPGLQAALVALDPGTGDVLALVGGRDFRVSPFNRATSGRRQPGSAFKPFVYAAALEHGFSPVSVLSGLQSVAVSSGPDEWRPRNAGLDAGDALTLRAALAASDNRAAVALEQRIGTRPVLRLAADAGLLNLPDVPSLALGTGVVSPLNLTAAFAVFPSGGFAVTPRAIVEVRDARGASVYETEPFRRRVLSDAAAFQMVSMLQDVVDRGTASGVRALGVRGPVGGKTGTTDGFRDAWFVGFSSSLVAGVWVGFDQPEAIGSNAYAARVAVPIWAEFMRRAARERPARAFDVPPSLIGVPLCAVSFLRPVDGCPTYVEYFKDGDEIPAQLCPVHRGSLRQRAERAIDGLLATIGRRLRDMFKR